MENAYFFDTYAVFEIIKGNSAYAQFKYAKVILTVFNLAELHYSLLRDFDKKLADKLLQEYAGFAVEVGIKTIGEASQFRFQYKNKKFSYTDAIGYATAGSFGLKFLTGDRQFESMPNVEFVK